MLTLYRILTYLLLPLAILFSFMGVLLLPAALTNVTLLLPLFILVATVIYIFSSFRFLTTAILRKEAMKHSSKDWIKVNGYVAMFWGIGLLIQAFLFYGKPEIYEQAQLQVEAFSKQMKEAEMNVNVRSLIDGILIFLGITGAVIVAHVTLTFRYLRAYAGAFENRNNNNVY